MKIFKTIGKIVDSINSGVKTAVKVVAALPAIYTLGKVMSTGLGIANPIVNKGVAKTGSYLAKSASYIAKYAGKTVATTVKAVTPGLKATINVLPGSKYIGKAAKFAKLGLAIPIALAVSDLTHMGIDTARVAIKGDKDAITRLEAMLPNSKRTFGAYLLGVFSGQYTRSTYLGG